MTTDISKVKENNWTLSLFIFLMMISTDSAIVTINDDRSWARVSWIIIMIICIYYIFKNKIYNKKALIYSCVFSISLLCTMIFSEKVFNVNYFQRMILVFAAFFVVQKYNYHMFMRSFVKLMKVICMISIIGVIFHDVICSMNIFPRFYAGDYAYEFMLFTNISHYSNRNWGPVWEPGAFQIYVNLALYYIIRYKENIKLSEILLFGITIITTKSTTGVVVLLIVLAYFVIFKKSSIAKKRNYNIRFLVVILGVAIVVFLLNSEEFMNQVFGKIQSFFDNRDAMNSANASSYVRFKGIEANIKLFIERPLFGWGSEQLIYEFESRYGFITNTCTVFAVGANYGLIPFVLYNMLWIKAILSEKNIKDGIILGGVIILLLMSENMLVSLLFWVLLIYESDIIKCKFEKNI